MRYLRGLARYGKKYQKYLPGGVAAAYNMYRKFAGRRSGGRGRKSAGRAVRSGYRVATSRTRTIVKRKPKKQTVMTDSSGHSMTMYRRALRKSYVPWRTMKDQQWRVVSADGVARVESSNGEQAGANFYHLHAAQMNQILLQLTPETEFGKCYVDNYYSEIMCTNQDSGNVKLMFYDMVVRRDAGLDLSSLLSSGYAELIKNGGNTISLSNLGRTPFESGDVTANYKINKVTTVYLSAGQSHTHKVFTKCRKVLDFDILATGTSYLSNWTQVTLVLQHGMPYNDRDTQTTVAVGDTAIDYVQTYKIRYKKMIDGGNAHLYYLKGQGALTNEFVMNFKNATAGLDVEA